MPQWHADALQTSGLHVGPLHHDHNGRHYEGHSNGRRQLLHGRQHEGDPPGRHPQDRTSLVTRRRRHATATQRSHGKTRTSRAGAAQHGYGRCPTQDSTTTPVHAHTAHIKDDAERGRTNDDGTHDATPTGHTTATTDEATATPGPATTASSADG